MFVYKRIRVATASQIELTSDSPVFDGQSMIAQSSDFSPNSKAERAGFDEQKGAAPNDSLSACSTHMQQSAHRTKVAGAFHFRTEILIVSGPSWMVVSL
ncbi:hypothetical protein [Bradyrhizobium cosmicum]|uniref:hypothetical protein n=1 Tax=Bradyrhizobium cosmicum TaxID=1404864 RepID=UPI0028E7B2BB|nr:hypothetical protein [Bradyrhizobium cosmicum]